MRCTNSRVLLTEENRALARQCGQALLARGYDVVGCVGDGRLIARAARSLCPDVILLNLVLPGADGFAVMNALSRTPLYNMPAVVMLLPVGMEAFAPRARDAGAFDVLMRPLDPHGVCDLLATLGPFDRLRPCWLLRDRIRRTMDALSIPKHLLGYAYLVDAIWLAGLNARLLRELTPLVYPEVGCLHETTGHLVERSIRNAIEVAWSRGEIETQYAFFGNSIDSRRGKPTNGEFIARVVDALRMEEL